VVIRAVQDGLYCFQEKIRVFESGIFGSELSRALIPKPGNFLAKNQILRSTSSISGF
jgi:hypothetical protein